MRKEAVGRMDRKVGPRATQGIWLQLLEGKSINHFCFVVTKFKRETSRPESPCSLVVPQYQAQVSSRGNLGEECKLWGLAGFLPARPALHANEVILDKIPNPSVPLFFHLYIPTFGGCQGTNSFWTLINRRKEE